MVDKRYQVYNMHGPTVFQADEDGLEQLCSHLLRTSHNSGLYRVVDIQTGNTVRAFKDGEEVFYYRRGPGNVKRVKRPWRVEI
jgi:hypothetical protein